MLTSKTNCALRTALLVATALATPAFAQTTEESAGAQPDSSAEEIVVTALKRSTAIQETPIAISAVTGENIANSGVQNIADFAGSVPSLTFVDAGPGSRRVVIRGIQSAGEPTVGVYYDETPVSGAIGSTNDAGRTTPELRLFDVERVEVLRGPQGTLYGSGSMGGTLRVIYNKPTFEDEAAADATTSFTEDGGTNYEINGVMNVPLVQDVLAARIVGFYRNREGWVDNVERGLKNTNDEESYGGRLLVRLTPTDGLTIDGAAYLQRTDASSPSWIVGAGNGRRNSDWLADQPITDDLDLYSLTANWDVGAVTVTGVVSLYERDLTNVTDVTRFIGNMRNAATCQRLRGNGTACSDAQQAAFNAYVEGFMPSALYPQQETKAFTAELRVGSNGNGPFNWTLGSFYSDRDTSVDNPQVLVDAASGDVIRPLQYATRRLIDDELQQRALFGEVSLDVTERLNLTAGARYFKYEKDIVGETPIPLDLVGARVTPPTRVGSEESGWVYKFNGSYKITDDIMVYAEAAEGFRPGGANQVLGLAEALTPYESDGLWNYELGIKTSWLDNRLTFNADVYQIDWDNIQVQGTTPNGAFSFISNAGAARVRGVEAELTARPVEGLLIQANGAYTNAKLTEDQVSNNVNAAGRKGDRIPYIPRFTAGLSAQYNWPVSNALEGLLRADVNHVGSSYSEFRPSNIYRRKIDSYELVNLRVGVESPEQQWGAYLFVTNLFDDTAIMTANSSAINVGRTVVFGAQPRTFGVNVRTAF